MNVIEKNKLKVILVITSILALVFTAIVGVEYLYKKRKERALKYYEEIAITVILADMLEMDLECSDNKGNTWVMKGNNTSLFDIVTQDIADYILGWMIYGFRS